MPPRPGYEYGNAVTRRRPRRPPSARGATAASCRSRRCQCRSGIRAWSRPEHLARNAGLEVTLYSSAGKRSLRQLSRQGPQLRWAAFEAANARSIPARLAASITTTY
jgi:hypothetical protein